MNELMDDFTNILKHNINFTQDLFGDTEILKYGITTILYLI